VDVGGGEGRDRLPLGQALEIKWNMIPVPSSPVDKQLPAPGSDRPAPSAGAVPQLSGQNDSRTLAPAAPLATPPPPMPRGPAALGAPVEGSRPPRPGGPTATGLLRTRGPLFCAVRSQTFSQCNDV